LHLLQLLRDLLDSPQKIRDSGQLIPWYVKAA
jgi:hypothetical protein